jgi:hypothetical protein
MRTWGCKIAVVLAVAWGSAAAVNCGDDSAGGSDAGTGGSGGSGAMDAGDGKSGTVGCLAPEEVPVACPTPKVTFANVQSIFQSRCVSACHNGVTPDPLRPGETLWPMIDPMHILDWEDSVRAWVGDCSMPPQDAGIPMTIEERRAVIQFTRCESRRNPDGAAPLR